MRTRIIIGAFVAAVVAAGAFTVWPTGGSDPARFSRDFRAAVAVQADRTRAMQEEAKGALTDNGGSVLAVYRAMLESAEASSELYEHLRAPRAYQPELKRVVELSKAEMNALRSIIKAAEAGRTQQLTAGLRTLAAAMADREGAIQKVLRDVDPPKSKALTHGGER